MNNLRKLAVATAVSAALGGTATVNALTLAEPGGALLVPYALCDSAAGVNTMVGIVQAGSIGIKGLTSFTLTNGPGVPPTITSLPFTLFDGQWPNAGNVAVFPPQDSTFSGNIHWFFFDPRSHELASGTLPYTHDDFVPFDWCSMVTLHDGGFGGPLDGQGGYLVFVDNAVWAAGGAAGSVLNLFGDAAVIQGNWGAAAWDPVIPMRDLNDTAPPSNCVVPSIPGGLTGPGVIDEVCWAGGVPNVNPVNAGQPLGDEVPNGLAFIQSHMDLRFFLGDLGLGADAETDLIFWFDQNYSNTANPWPLYTNLSVNVYDEDEVTNNTPIDLPDELNIIDARTVGWTITKQSGFIEVILPEADPDFLGGEGGEPDNIVGSTVSMALIWFGPNPSDGVQTVIAHNRGLW